MNNNYFVYNGEKYIVEYKNNIISIYKYNNGNFELLFGEELQSIKILLNTKYGYTYDSELLNNIVNDNPKMENKEYIINFLSWLENVIPKDCRDNFYRNVATLQTNLNIDVDLSNCQSSESEYSISAVYNTSSNSLTMKENFLRELWRIAQSNANPQDFYWRYYSNTLLHELAHMASSRYDAETKSSLCGFDKFPSENEDDKNRGLTEGFTEIISMAGVSGTMEISSGYYIEACIINQLIQIIGNETFLKSYFSNLGTKPMQERLNEIINNPNISYNLFRSIELNYNIGDINEEQNILGNIQLSILDYLDKKIELLLSDNIVNEASRVLTNYESMMISSEKLKIMQKNPQQFVGIDESIKKFTEIKNKYEQYLNEGTKSSGIKK